MQGVTRATNTKYQDQAPQQALSVPVRIFDDGGATGLVQGPGVDHASGTWRAPDLRLLIDRRRSPRKAVKGDAMAVFASGKGAGTLARVRLADASWVGLGLSSPIAVEPGTSVSVIPEDAMSPRQIGIVVRCEPEDDGGFRVGVQCRTGKPGAPRAS